MYAFTRLPTYIRPYITSVIYETYLTLTFPDYAQPNFCSFFEHLGLQGVNSIWNIYHEYAVIQILKGHGDYGR